MTYRPSKRMMAARRKRVQQRNRRIAWGVAVFFILANIVLGAIMWPKVLEYRKAVQDGKIDPVIEIRINK